MLKGLKERFPEVHIQAFTAIELGYLAELANLPLDETLMVLKDAGLGSIPGGGAEIFAKRVRRKICGEKLIAEDWLNVHEAAHGSDYLCSFQVDGPKGEGKRYCQPHWVL